MLNAQAIWYKAIPRNSAVSSAFFIGKLLLTPLILENTCLMGSQLEVGVKWKALIKRGGGKNQYM
jgi:hypothetical protein